MHAHKSQCLDQSTTCRVYDTLLHYNILYLHIFGKHWSSFWFM